ncbi:LysM peptidoglycan-binding domain-containing protein [Clostridium ventriculi]|nr:LysM peptidoglycan-binding domain-containing protein [Sarcina ventriculi]
MTSTKSAYTLGLIWLSNYERPNNPYQPIRGELSQQWYELLSNTISSITYTVKLGNTLSEIAEKYNVTVDNLKQWNNISNSNIIYPGQILKIY